MIPFVKRSTYLKLARERDSLLYEIDRRDETIKDLADLIRAHDQLIYSMSIMRKELLDVCTKPQT